MASLRLRAALYVLIREFFTHRAVLEVETPVLSAAGNTEPNIEGFTTTFSGHVDAGPARRYLRTSAEYPLKRLLARGLGDCYELGRVFRNGEAGGCHNPEFTMLEWYRVGLEAYQLADETVELIQAAWRLLRAAADGVGSHDGAPALSICTTHYRQLFLDTTGIDPFTADATALQAPLARFHIDPDGLTRDDWLDLVFTHLIQPGFPGDRVTVVHDWPASQCALARIRADEPPVAERFELYLGAYELANGYHELNDVAEQRARFERENQRRSQRGQVVLPLDEKFLAVVGQLPDCAGVALGIERLLMCLMGTDRIGDVMAFTFADA